MLTCFGIKILIFVSISIRIDEVHLIDEPPEMTTNRSKSVAKDRDPLTYRSSNEPAKRMKRSRSVCGKFSWCFEYEISFLINFGFVEVDYDATISRKKIALAKDKKSDTSIDAHDCISARISYMPVKATNRSSATSLEDGIIRLEQPPLADHTQRWMNGRLLTIALYQQVKIE